MAAPGIPILTFHALDEVGTVLSFSPRVFERGLAHLHAWGYRALTLADVAAKIRQRAELPERAVVLTFDDGYRSVYEHAFPILQRWQMPATIFLTVGTAATDRLPSFGGREMLSWAEIREMQKCGIAFGAHTLTHPNLTRLPLADAEREMRVSQEIIAQALGVAVETLAYPGGRSNARVRAIAQKYFACACTDALGLASVRSDPYALARVEAFYLRGDRRFALIPARAFPWYLRALNLPRCVRRALAA